MASDRFQPLVSNQPISKQDGTPTDYFIRWAQQRQIDIGEGITAAQAEQLVNDAFAARHVIAGTHMSGGGALTGDVTLNWAGAALGDLDDVDFTTPPTDQQVIVFDAATSTWIPADQSGGGGGGGGPVKARYWRIRGVAGVPGHLTDGMGFMGVNWRTAGGVALVGTGTPLASYTDGSWSLAQAFDGDITSNGHGWYSGNGDGRIDQAAPWIGYDFGHDVTPATVEYAPLHAYTWTVPAQVAHDYSADGIVWQELELVVNSPGISGAIQSHSFVAGASGGGGGGGGGLKKIALDPASGANRFQSGMMTYEFTGITETLVEGNSIYVKMTAKRPSGKDRGIVVSINGTEGYGFKCQADGNKVAYRYVGGVETNFNVLNNTNDVTQGTHIVEFWLSVADTATGRHYVDGAGDYFRNADKGGNPAANSNNQIALLGTLRIFAITDSTTDILITAYEVTA